MHLKPAGIYTGIKGTQGKGQACMSPALRARLAGATSSRSLLRNSRHISLQGSPGRGTCSCPSASVQEHTPAFNPAQTTQGTGSVGHPGSTLTKPHPSPCSCSMVTVKIHLQKLGLKLRRHKLSSNLELCRRCRGISKELLAQILILSERDKKNEFSC